MTMPVLFRAMDGDIVAIDLLLERAAAIDSAMSPHDLRVLRGELVRTSVFVSYAIGVLSVDIKVLNRASGRSTEEVLATLVEEMPEIIANSWVGGGWSLSPDAPASVSAAADLVNGDSQRLLTLHGELVSSDLGDLDVVSTLLSKIREQRQLLSERRDQLESRIRSIQQVMKEHYASGAASVDDWLN